MPLARTLSLALFVSLLISSVFADPALAGRPIPVHHQESAYVGPTYWATVPYTRGRLVDVTRDLTLRGIAIWADFAASETCEPRVYDASGTLRASGPPQNGQGTGSGTAVDWWSLPIDTELFAGETVTLAVYCTASTTTAYHPHRDPPSGQVDATGYFVNVRNQSFFGNGFPNGSNTWWGDWRLDVEAHGLHDEYATPGTSTGGNMSNSRGARLTTTREHLVTGADVYLDLDPGENCTPQIFDAGGTIIAEGSVVVGDGGGLHWYRSDFSVYFGSGSTYTVALYCAQSTFTGWSWNETAIYTLLDDAIDVRGRSGGGDGIPPTTANAITPVMQLREGEVELVDRDGTSSSGSSTWSEWTWGWQLTPERFMLLEGIEVLNIRNSGDAFARVYDTATGALIAAGATPAPRSDELEWRLAPLPDVPLLPGKQYTVAIYYSGGATSAPFYAGTSGPYERLGVLSDVAFCASNSSLDTMPTNCTYNQRIERLIVSAPEPGFAAALGLGVLALGVGARRRRVS